MKTFECHYNGAVLTVSAENKADAERYAGYILGVGRRTWKLYIRELPSTANLMVDEMMAEKPQPEVQVAMCKLMLTRGIK
jgi:hypothetical protein